MEPKSLAEQTEEVLNSAISEGTAEKQTADILEVLSYLHRRIVALEVALTVWPDHETPVEVPTNPKEKPADESVQ